MYWLAVASIVVGLFLVLLGACRIYAMTARRRSNDMPWVDDRATQGRTTLHPLPEVNFETARVRDRLRTSFTPD
jgi:hypothetical protein